MDKKLLIHGTLIDGNGGEPLCNSAVVIEGQKIKKVYSFEDMPEIKDAEIIDATGKFIIPGLIEAHGKLYNINDSDEVLSQFLKMGVTTVAAICKGDEFYKLREDIASGTINGLSGILIGKIVSSSGGHIKDEFTGPADGVDDIRKTVKRLSVNKPDYIKTTASGGFWKKDDEYLKVDYTKEELKALADEAHACNMACAVHCHITPGLTYSVEAGINQVHNGVYADKKSLELMRDKGCFFVPALRLTCQKSIDGYNKDHWKYPEIQELHFVHRETVALAYKTGVKIMVGTNYSYPSSYWKIGEVMAIEMMELKSCGLSAMEVIVAATKTNAEGYGKENEIGTVEEGKFADMVILNKNPLEDISVFGDELNIDCVIKNGAIYKNERVY